MVDGIPKNPLFSPKAMETWLILMAEAMRGTAEAQEAFKSLTTASSSPEELKQWLARFMPFAGTTAATPELFEDWLEEWWKAMGVVPRSRYLELLERYEILRTRLEKADETIHKLRAMLGKDHEQDAQKILNLWDTMLQESLKAQAEWMRTWVSTTSHQNSADKPESEP
jgi:hypothetical protein